MLTKPEPLVLPPARTVVYIDPNVRVRGNLTFSDRKPRHWPVKVGEEVTAVWEETSLASTGTVVEVDDEKGLVFLSVDWEGFKPREIAYLTGTPFYADELAAMKVGAVERELERLRNPGKPDSREAIEARLRQLEQSSPR